MHHLVVGDGKDEILREGVHHGEGDVLVMVLAEPGVHLQVVAHVVHPAHVPLQVEAQAADIGGAGHHGPGGGLLRDHQHAGVHAERHGVQLPQEVDGLQVLMSAVFVGRPGAALAVVVQIQHGRHGVHPQAVDVVFLQPEPGGGEQEALDLGAAVVKDTGAPGGVLPLVGVAVLVAAAAVELVQALLVLAEVGGDPVQQDGDAVFVHVVHEPHKVVGRAEPGGGGEIPRTLIAPGIVQGMLRHRQQLDGGVAHFLDIGRQLPGQIPVINEITVVPSAPGAQVDLINIQGGIIDLVLPLFLLEGLVRPAEAADVVQLAGCGGAGLRMEAVGVRLHMYPAVTAQNGIFISGVRFQTGDEALPDLVLSGKAVRVLVPAVEIADHGHAPGMGCPDPEHPSGLSSPFGRMGAEPAPPVGQRAAMEQRGLIVFCLFRHECSSPRRMPGGLSSFSWGIFLWA